MKQGRTLIELAQELQRQQSAKRDFIVPSKMMEMTDAGYMTICQSDKDIGNQETFLANQHFHRQIGTALKIPALYYDRMREEAPELLARNVNTWLGLRNSAHMVRTLDGTARAFLSNSYRRIDNAMVAEATLPIIAEIDGVRIESCQVTDERMYLKAVNPRLETEVVPGDIVQSGILISNSEVGQGSVSVMPLLYRLVCTNGMVVNDMGQRKYHIGRANTENWELFTSATLEADDHAFMLKLADIVRSVVDETRFHKIVDRLRESTGVKITGQVQKVVELTGKEYQMQQKEQEGILDHLIRGGDFSLYGLSNAVTRAAHDVESYDRSTAMEAIGWNIVTMPQKQWNQINEASMAA